MVENFGGHAIISKTGHAFVKSAMRKAGAIYGGEISAHHYFRDFAYCDSGMIPWLLVAELISVSGRSLSELIGERMEMYPASGEINRQITDVNATIKALHDHFSSEAISVENIDGYGFEFSAWRFNIRTSNTEPVVRLNVESRGDVALMRAKTAEVLAIMET